MISSLSLAQSPSKPGTATVQNHRFQWLQLPPASSRQDPGPKISWRRAGALAEPGSPSPPPIAGAMGRAGRDRDRQQRLAGQPRKHRSTSARRGLTTAARPRTAPLGPPPPPPASSAHPAPARQPPGAGGRPPAGPRTSPRRRAQLAAATASSSAAATETKAPASRRPSPAPRRTTAAARAGPAAPPRALLRPAELPEALPAAALVGLQHRGGLGPTADRRLAGQPDQLQQPPQQSGDVQLAFRSVSHLRGSSCHSNACRPCWVMACSPRSQVSEPSAASASPTMRSSSARSRPSAATTTMVSDPWWIAQSRAPADRSTTQASRWSRPRGRLREAHRVVFAPQEETRPSPCASRSEGREEQR
jgi:hypothetical protein